MPYFFRHGEQIDCPASPLMSILQWKNCFMATLLNHSKYTVSWKNARCFCSYNDTRQVEGALGKIPSASPSPTHAPQHSGSWFLPLSLAFTFPPSFFPPGVGLSQPLSFPSMLTFLTLPASGQDNSYVSFKHLRKPSEDGVLPSTISIMPDILYFLRMPWGMMQGLKVLWK